MTLGELFAVMDHNTYIIIHAINKEDKCVARGNLNVLLRNTPIVGLYDSQVTQITPFDLFSCDIDIIMKAEDYI